MARSRSLANLQPTVTGPVSATTLAASGAVSGAGFTTYFGAPPALGGTTPAAVTATVLSATQIASLPATRFVAQAAPATYAGAATLTAADLRGGIVTYTGAAAALTLPTGANLDALLTTMAVDQAIDFTIINTGSGAATLTANTGVTIVGTAAISQQNSATWRLRRTAAATYIAYRLAG